MEEDKKFTNGYRAGSQAARIKRLEEEIKHVRETQAKLFVKLDALIPAVAELRVKSSVWGAAAGVLGALITVGIAVALKIL